MMTIPVKLGMLLVLGDQVCRSVTRPFALISRRHLLRACVMGTPGQGDAARRGCGLFEDPPEKLFKIIFWRYDCHPWRRVDGVRRRQRRTRRRRSLSEILDDVANKFVDVLLRLGLGLLQHLQVSDCLGEPGEALDLVRLILR
jgi:hypothetical protein